MSVRHLCKDKYEIDISMPGTRPPKEGRARPRRNRFRVVVRANNMLHALMIEKGYRKGLGHELAAANTISNIAQPYLEYVQRTWSPMTYRDKFRMINKVIIPHFGNMTPDTIVNQPLLIEAFKGKRLKEHPGINREINLEILCLKAMIRWAKKHKLCDCVLEKVEPLKYNRPVPKYISREELTRLIDAMSVKHRAMFTCLYNAGLRKAEACTLRVKNIFFDPDYLYVKGKGDRKRIVPMTANLKRRILEYRPDLKSANPEDLLFPSRVKTRNGKPTTRVIGDLRAVIKSACAKAGITRHITPHMLRHAFATHMLESKADIRDIQAAMGHKDIATTQIYTKVNFGHLSDVVTNCWPDEK